MLPGRFGANVRAFGPCLHCRYTTRSWRLCPTLFRFRVVYLRCRAFAGSSRGLLYSRRWPALPAKGSLEGYHVPQGGRGTCSHALAIAHPPSSLGRHLVSTDSRCTSPYTPPSHTRTGPESMFPNHVIEKLQIQYSKRQEIGTTRTCNPRSSTPNRSAAPEHRVRTTMGRRPACAS